MKRFVVLKRADFDGMSPICHCLGSLRHGVLGQFSRQQQTFPGLNSPRCWTFVVSQPRSSPTCAASSCHSSRSWGYPAASRRRTMLVDWLSLPDWCRLARLTTSFVGKKGDEWSAFLVRDHALSGLLSYRLDYKWRKSQFLFITVALTVVRVTSPFCHSNVWSWQGTEDEG